MSSFIDFAAVESGDEDDVAHVNEEPAGDTGYDTSDGFVVANEDNDAELAKTRAARRRAEKTFEKNVDQAELEEETRQLALDHGLAIPQERRRLKRQKKASQSSEALDDSMDTFIVEEEEAAEQEQVRTEMKWQRREAKLKRRAAAAVKAKRDKMRTLHSMLAFEDYVDMRDESSLKRPRSSKKRREGRRHIAGSSSGSNDGLDSEERIKARNAIAAVGKIPKIPGRAWTVDLF